jgi:hypothetical protein
VQVIRAIDATKRKPPGTEVYTFYSLYDLWLFAAVLDTRVCEECRFFEEMGSLRGDMLRTWLKYHEIVDVNTIQANVHPNCRCTLTRYVHVPPP